MEVNKGFFKDLKTTFYQLQSNFRQNLFQDDNVLRMIVTVKKYFVNKLFDFCAYRAFIYIDISLMNNILV